MHDYNEFRETDGFVEIRNQTDQLRLIFQAKAECYLKINRTSMNTNDNSPRCEVVWDRLLCWDEAPPGVMMTQHCPNYVNGFYTERLANRYCTPNGTWFVHPTYNKTWTNFSQCQQPPDDLHNLAEGAGKLKLLYTIGYGISLGSLIIAVFIMMCCRGLKSKSNSLHINLFFAFILRASFSFIKGALFVKHVGLSIDIKYASDGSIMFDQTGTHWICRMLVSLFLYSICASQMWIFMEGLYLHNLIYRTLSTERRGVRLYIILGWLSPLTFLIPWVVVKSTIDNHYCWTIGGKKDYFWILHGPLLATVVINFVFFLDILRVMCGRVRASTRHMGKTKYRRLAKFVLVLIPLFGIMYIVFHVAFPARFQSMVDITHLYIEMTYNSLQGFILALLFCFLNEEVHRELKRIWLRQKSRRGDGTALTRSFAMSSFKRGPSSCRMQNGRVISKKNDKEDILKKIKSGARNFFRIPETNSSIVEEKDINVVIEEVETIFKDKNDNRHSGTAL